MLFPIGDDNIDGGYTPWFSRALIAVNIGVFVFEASLSPGAQAALTTTYGAIPNHISNGFGFPTLFTSMFLHGSWVHLLGNMLYLWIFADNIEAIVGSRRFILFYLLGGLAAGLTQVFIQPDSPVPCIGASGAIAAIMGAYIVMFPHSRVKMILLLFFMVFYIPSWVFLGFWFVQQAMTAIGALGLRPEDSGGVAWWAHVGGFVFGLIAGRYFKGMIRQEDYTSAA